MMDIIFQTFSQFSIEQTAGAFIVLMAIIDVLGSTPIFLNLQAKGADGRNYNIKKTINLLRGFEEGSSVAP